MKTYSKKQTGLMASVVLVILLFIPTFLLAQQADIQKRSAEQIIPTDPGHEQLLKDMSPQDKMFPKGQRQESMQQESDSLGMSMLDMANKSHLKSTGVRFTTDTDALINGLIIGRGTGDSETNVAIGNITLFNNTIGIWNTAIGAQALYFNTSGSNNTASGSGALSSNSIGGNNTASGVSALYYNSTGNFNTGIGTWALFSNKANHRSTAIGYHAMYFADNRTTGHDTYNTAVGFGALKGSTIAANNIGRYNTAIGDQALFSNSSGSYNAAGGVNALYSNTIGLYNTALGYEALSSNTEGGHNTAVGLWALLSNTTGSNNTAIGKNALQLNRVNSRSTAIGYMAMCYADDRTTGAQETYNTAVGFEALKGSETPADNTGKFNTAVGDQALANNTSGTYNNALGRAALIINSTGQSNAAYGNWALGENTTGSGNTAVGNNAGDWRNNVNYGTFVGNNAYANVNGLTNVAGYGYNARPLTSNTVIIGNASVTHVGSHAGWFQTSDGSYKSDIEENVPGLDFILKLRPVTYHLDVHKLAAHLEEDMGRDENGEKSMAEPCELKLKSRDEKSAILYTGFVAQEVEAASRDIGYAFNGISAPQNDNGLYSINYAAFTVPIVKAIQEQQLQLDRLSPEGFDTLMDEVQTLKEENETLQARQDELMNENLRMQQQLGEMLALLGTLSDQVQNCCQAGADAENGTGSRRQSMNQPLLEQNIPNPFTENTLISYYLPEGFRTASIIVTDINGTQLMHFTLSEPGFGHVVIEGGSLGAGTYVYTLVVNGRRVDSKRMVLVQ